MGYALVDRTSERVRQSVIKIAQELLLSEEDRTAITPDLITEKIDPVVSVNPKWRIGLDRLEARNMLIPLFSYWMDQNATRADGSGRTV